MKDKVHEVNEFPKVHCMSCHKEVQAYYGHWGNSGTCSSACERKVVSEIDQRWRNPVTKDEE